MVANQVFPFPGWAQFSC